jgi:hypothetical protein
MSSILLGFGAEHERITRRVALAILEAAASGGREAASETAKESLASPDDGCYVFQCVSDDQHVAVHGHYMHVRRDHPMSPDGWASATFDWVAVRWLDDDDDFGGDYVAIGRSDHD